MITASSAIGTARLSSSAALHPAMVVTEFARRMHDAYRYLSAIRHEQFVSIARKADTESAVRVRFVFLRRLAFFPGARIELF
jgi:hypothetical protein